MLVAFAFGAVLPASAAIRLVGATPAGPDVQLRAFNDPLVQQIVAIERRRPRDTALCNKPDIVPLVASGGILVPYACNGLTLLTSYTPPTYGTASATASYAEFIESSAIPASAAVSQGLYGVAFPSAPLDTTPAAYLEFVGVSPYPSVTFAGGLGRFSADNMIVSTSITKGATFEILGYRWDPVQHQYLPGYASGPFTSRYGTLASFTGFLDNGEVIPQLSRLYFVIYACANAACT